MNRAENHDNPPFRPTLEGCVAKDPRMARAVEECYQGQLASVAAYTYRSLVTEGVDRELSRRMDEIAVEKAEHFRMLGELILALGGDPIIRTQLRVGGMERQGEEGGIPAQSLPLLIKDAIREERITVDRLQSLMGRTRDRVVRSLLAYILSDEERHIAFLQGIA